MFKERFNTLYKQSHLSQSEFGKLFGANTNQVYNWRNGKGEPNISTLVSIAQAFKVSVDWLVGNPSTDEGKEKNDELHNRLNMLDKIVAFTQKKLAKQEKDIQKFKEITKLFEIKVMIDTEVEKRQEKQRRSYIKNHIGKPIQIKKLPYGYKGKLKI